MKKLILLIAITLNLFLQSQNSNGGRTCGTETLPLQFETWLNGLTPTLSNSKFGTAQINSSFNIPVIVHIIHNNGEAVNSPFATTGNNINAAQVINQINILNQDFNGLNSDTSAIPNVFKPRLGKFQINFCLAVVNPTGGILAEPGIDRVNRNTKGWTAMPYTINYFNTTVKPNSIWDPTKYLNIWVTQLSGGTLGFATFPNPGTSGLGGLTGSFGTATTDGVVILNTAFGSIGTGSGGVYNLGRTTTHEIGHWLGLRHIWGDGNCANDFVNDTPPAQNGNFGCPNFPFKVGVCSGNTTGEMTMNYMDYTNDACMYMFTNDQKFRAQLILVNSPMRAALLTSTVCNLPAVGNDIGITYVARPTYSQTIGCVDFIDPIIFLTNFGTTTLSTAFISYNVDGVNTQTLNWTGTAAPNTSFTVAIPTITGLTAGSHVFSVNVSQPNGGADNNLTNNNNQQIFSIANILTITVNSSSTCAGIPTTISASGGSSYSWSGIANVASVSVSPSVTTIYSVTIFGTGCSVMQTATVEVLPSPNMSVNDATICAATQTVLTASGASSYTWSTGANTSSISVNPIAPTNYSVVGTGTNGCNSTIAASVNILPSPTLAVNNQTICSGGTATLAATGANSYSWSTGSTSSSLVLTPSVSTSYTVYGTTGTCMVEIPVSVSIGTALSIYIQPSSAQICLGSSVTFSATGANNYTWSNNQNTSTITVAPSASASYTVFGLSGTCPGTQVITVTVNALPLTTIASTPVTCFSSSNGQIAASSSGAGPFTYTYSAGTNALAAGVYTVQTRDANNCVSINTVNVSQPAPITTNANVGATNCSASCDGTVNITFSGGNAPMTSTIYPLALTAQNYTNLCAGSYTYLITDSKGCAGIGFFVVQQGTASITVTTSINNLSCDTCADATIAVLASGGKGPYTYSWQPGNFSGSILQNVSAGCYTVYVKDAVGCLGEAQRCIVYDPYLNINSHYLHKIQLAPNPNTGLFVIKGMTLDAKKIEVFDVLGKIVFKTIAVTENANINISECPKGLYYVRIINSAGTTITSKIILE
jgi:hypothetical protein